MRSHLRGQGPRVAQWEVGEEISRLEDLRGQPMSTVIRAGAEQIKAASEAVGAPISLGTIDRIADGPELFNTQLLWDGTSGPVGRHDKKYIQPFGEWLPWRGLFEALFPVAESAGHFLAGDGSGTLETSGVVTGVATCFEVAFDSAVRTPVVQSGVPSCRSRELDTSPNGSQLVRTRAAPDLRAGAHRADNPRSDR